MVSSELLRMRVWIIYHLREALKVDKKVLQKKNQVFLVVIQTRKRLFNRRWRLQNLRLMEERREAKHKLRSLRPTMLIKNSKQRQQYCKDLRYQGGKAQLINILV